MENETGTTPEWEESIWRVGNGVKTLISIFGSALIVGAIFWAGATYNRVEGIERRLIGVTIYFTD
jgi:hypothetical protein